MLVGVLVDLCGLEIAQIVQNMKKILPCDVFVL